MAFSVESRVPFLTTDLAELLLALPEEYVVGDDGTSKRVFRAAMMGIVPDAILDRRDKIGFWTPEAAWLRQRRDLLESATASSGVCGCIVPDGMRQRCEETLAGRKPFDWQIWRLVNFVRWHAALLGGNMTARAA